MEIKIDIRKNIYENINELYEKIRELKNKKENLEKLIKENEEKLKNIEKEIEVEKKKEERKRNKKWYEKFRWMFTSNGFLLIAGKDVNTNEILINKYLEKKDLVLHADIIGSPFGILKNGQEAKENDIYEAAKFVSSYSRAWKNKLSSVDVYYVYPEQVSKKAPSGMYIKKGSFMIYGKKNYLKVKLEIAFGFKDFEIFPGIPESIINKYENYVILIPGNKKPLDIAKEINKIFKIDIDDIIKYLPGDSEIYSIRGSGSI
jgi:predicted ribosome quality control (RQC) complex YloA/Tae2 family protein